MRLLGSYFHIAMNGMAASEKLFRILDASEPGQGDEGGEGRVVLVAVWLGHAAYFMFGVKTASGGERG